MERPSGVNFWGDLSSLTPNFIGSEESVLLLWGTRSSYNIL